jgi:hypothetical protein
MGQHSAHQPAVGRTQRSSMWNLKVELTSGPQRFVGSLGHEKKAHGVYNDSWNIQHQYGSSVGNYEPLTTWDMPPRSPKYFFYTFRVWFVTSSFPGPLAYFLSRSLTKLLSPWPAMNYMWWTEYFFGFNTPYGWLYSKKLIISYHIWYHIYILYIYIYPMLYMYMLYTHTNHSLYTSSLAPAKPPSGARFARGRRAGCGCPAWAINGSSFQVED